jgi:hypothetical protein
VNGTSSSPVQFKPHNGGSTTAAVVPGSWYGIRYTSTAAATGAG